MLLAYLTVSIVQRCRFVFPALGVLSWLLAALTSFRMNPHHTILFRASTSCSRSLAPPLSGRVLDLHPAVWLCLFGDIDMLPTSNRSVQSLEVHWVTFSNISVALLLSFRLLRRCARLGGTKGVGRRQVLPVGQAVESYKITKKVRLLTP